MSKLPYLRMYVGDALSDEKLAGLGLAAWGAWMKVLFVMWKAQQSPIQKTRRAWCFTLSCTPDEFEAVLLELSDNDVGHIQTSGDFVTFHSKRLAAEIGKIESDRERKRTKRAEARTEEGQDEDADATVESAEPKPKPPKKDPIPQLGEVVDHFVASGSSRREAENFFNYYESVGWTVGRAGKQMKKWKSAAARWINNESDFKPAGKQGMTFAEMKLHAVQNRRTVVADYRQQDGKWFAA